MSWSTLQKQVLRRDPNTRIVHINWEATAPRFLIIATSNKMYANQSTWIYNFIRIFRILIKASVLACEKKIIFFYEKN